LQTEKSPLHILIIGGGIGGLCLAQGLKKSGISVAVYERDGSALFRDQGYRISIKQEGSQALRDCLPENLFKLCVATAIRPATRLVFLDQQLQQKFAKPLLHFAPTLHLTETPDYFSWTLSLPAAFRGADGLTLHRLGRSLVKDWHPALRRLFDEADIPATFPVCISTAQAVNQLSTPNVTLLGDAIHTMSPGRGEGASVALRDAQLLRHALIDVVTSGVSLAQAKAQYEREMLRYGFEAVSNSLNNPYLPGAKQAPS
jgi:2-polyprenyl-6-methoxyphenol hydroxylase-like FAD-dependent oxidoreductase